MSTEVSIRYIRELPNPSDVSFSSEDFKLMTMALGNVFREIAKKQNLPDDENLPSMDLTYVDIDYLDHLIDRCIKAADMLEFMEENEPATTEDDE